MRGWPLAGTSFPLTASGECQRHSLRAEGQKGCTEAAFTPHPNPSPARGEGLSACYHAGTTAPLNLSMMNSFTSSLW